MKRVASILAIILTMALVSAVCVWVAGGAIQGNTGTMPAFEAIDQMDLLPGESPYPSQSATLST